MSDEKSTGDRLRGWGGKAAEAARKAKGAYDEHQAGRAEQAAAATADPTRPLFSGMSHDEGRNAEVVLYRDRIERTKQRSRLSLSSAHQDVEVTPVRAVSSVQVSKDGHRSKVTVYASGNNIEFRFDHDQAHAFRDALMQLVLAGEQPAPAAAAPAAPAAADPMEQLRKLGELRDAGILSSEEFEAKKAEILARM